jgi:arylsulfatase A-like enzyme
MPGKPEWLQQKRPLPPEQVAVEVDQMRLNQLRALKQVDISVRDIVGKLRDQGKLDNTLIVFFSDNGFFWGEHRLITKNRIYEEASRIPLMIRYPALAGAPRNEDRLVAVTDLAPTICELAGIPIPEDVDGRSLVSLLKGSDQWRDALLLEGWPRRYYDDEDEEVHEKRKLGREQRRAHYQAIRTAQYVYAETDLDTAELYDTVADPYQLTNLVNDPRHLELVRRLTERLHNEKF